MTPASRNWDDASIRRQRLHNHQLVASTVDDPADVVRSMGAIQAQDYGQSLWAIASRLRRPSLDTVVDAVRRGTILRTWPMRGTLHWVPAEDAAWMVSLSADRVGASLRRRHAELGVTPGLIADAGAVAEDELRGGNRLQRRDLLRLWSKAGLSPEGQRGAHLLGALARAGLLAVGPMDGKQQTFLLLGEWAPNPRALSAPEGLVELARRYFASHGPAGDVDFAWWAGVPVTAARTAIAANDLTAVEIDGRRLWQRDDRAARRGATQLIAGFDEYVLGYTRRDDVVATADFERVVPGSNGIFFPCVLVDGEVIGTWKRTFGRQVDVAVTLFPQRTCGRVDLDRAIEGYADATGLPLGTVTVN